MKDEKLSKECCINKDNEVVGCTNEEIITSSSKKRNDISEEGLSPETKIPKKGYLDDVCSKREQSSEIKESALIKSEVVSKNSEETTKKQDDGQNKSIEVQIDKDGNVHTDQKGQSQQGPKKKAKKMKTKNIDPAILKVRRSIQMCCATNNLVDAISIYEYAIEKSIKIEAQTFYNLINLCDGLSERPVHIGTPNNTDKKNGTNAKANNKPQQKKKKQPEFQLEGFPVVGGETNEEKKNFKISIEERKNHAFTIKKHMDKLSLPLNENAYTALIRILAKSNDVEAADQILQEAEKCQQCKPKLRMYSSLILTHCNLGNMEDVLSLWSRMHEIKGSDRLSNVGQEKIEPSEREYCAMMKCATSIGDFKVMDRVLADLAEDILVPSTDTTETICSWFRSQFSVLDNTFDLKESHLDKIKLPFTDAPSLGPLCCKSGYSWEISHAVRIDPQNATLLSGCMKGAKLNPVPLSSKAWAEMLEMNETIVIRGSVEGDDSEFAGGGKGKKRFARNGNNKDAEEKRIRKWNKFKQFLEQELGPPAENYDSYLKNKTVENITHSIPVAIKENGSQNIDASKYQKKRYDVVIDGANVGYYKQNFANAPKHVDYKQIDWVVQHFQNESKNVLLVMHERHFASFMIPHWAKPIVEKWSRDGVLYKTPFGSNDDWFWMHASLWCGKSTMVLSNDLMRDHHFQMLAKRSFLRWKERHQVHFSFGEWYSISGENRRKLVLTYPDIYSRRIQRISFIPSDCEKEIEGLVIPLAKRGDQQRFLDGCFEADDKNPKEESYVCICPRNISKDK